MKQHQVNFFKIVDEAWLKSRHLKCAIIACQAVKSAFCQFTKHKKKWH